MEESKEADTTTKEATHRISRGIHDKVDNLCHMSELYLINQNYIEKPGAHTIVYYLAQS